MNDTNRQNTRAIAERHLAAGDALGWFDEVYAAAGEDLDAIPWAEAEANPNLVQWLDRADCRGEGRQALVVGCGLGDDAEELSRRGFKVTAFDISPSSIGWCGKRFPYSKVAYQAADLFQAPEAWCGYFDFIFEAYTLQSLPPELRPMAMKNIAQFLAPGGILLVVARGRDGHEPAMGPPWPLTHAELGTLEASGLVEESFEDYGGGGDPGSRRFRVVYGTF